MLCYTSVSLQENLIWRFWHVNHLETGSEIGSSKANTQSIACICKQYVSHTCCTRTYCSPIIVRAPPLMLSHALYLTQNDSFENGFAVRPKKHTARHTRACHAHTGSAATASPHRCFCQPCHQQGTCRVAPKLGHGTAPTGLAL